MRVARPEEHLHLDFPCYINSTIEITGQAQWPAWHTNTVRKDLFTEQRRESKTKQINLYSRKP